VLLLVAVNLRAEIQFDVTVGIEGYIPEGSWFPIVCEVNNDGPAFQGVIEVVNANFGQSLARQVQVELPTGTRKLITIPVFNSGSYGQWRVTLKDAGGRLRADPGLKQPSGFVNRGTVLLGALSRMPSWKPPFQTVAQGREWQPVVGRFLRAMDVPDNPIVLEGMDALYLNSERAETLKVQQVAALESWVNSGGHLIVAVEQISDVTGLAWLRRLLPVDLSGVTSVEPGTALEDWLRSPIPRSLAQDANFRTYNTGNRQTKTNVTVDAPFVNTPYDTGFGKAQLNVATGTVRPVGRVVAAIGETPVVVSALHGNGRITVMLFSPEREPVKSWRNLPTFWARIANVPARLYVSGENLNSGGQGTDGIFGAMIDSRQVRKLPIWQLLLMLIVYLAVIGPVDQLWLRKIGKPMLTWITFPCYVALFSGLIYLVGYKLRAGEAEWNELHVVDVYPAGEKVDLRGHTYGSIYSPVNERYNFQSAALATAFRPEFAGSWNTDQGADRGRIVQSENSFKAEVFVPVWTCQLYANDWLQRTEAPFFASLDESANGWTVKVQNKLAKPLTNVRLVIKGRVHDLGDVAAGQLRQFTERDTRNATMLADFVNRHGNMFESVVNQRRSAFGASEGGRLNDLPDASQAVSFLASRQARNNYNNFQILPTLDLSAAAEQNNAILLAWAGGHAAAKPLNQFAPRRTAVNTLWRMTLPLPSKP
jgi:hypothetical protein